MKEENAYKKLALTAEQEEVLKELEKAAAKAIGAGLYFVMAPSSGWYAYNTKEVSCFNAPSNAAYDNGKDEIDVTLLRPAKIGLNFNEILDYNETKCLVAFD